MGALIVAMGQASYAFAPAVLGFVLSASAAGGPHLGMNTSAFLLAVAAVQVIAILSFLAGRHSA